MYMDVRPAALAGTNGKALADLLVAHGTIQWPRAEWPSDPHDPHDPVGSGSLDLRPWLGDLDAIRPVAKATRQVPLVLSGATIVGPADLHDRTLWAQVRLTGLCVLAVEYARLPR